jgi:hypothetical protein
MDLTNFNRRIFEQNPLYPYSWEARYEGGGRLRQFDFDGHHWSTEIDKTKVKALVILGHPISPIVFEKPQHLAKVSPDEVIIEAQVSLEVPAGGVQPVNRIVRCYFGYVYELKNTDGTSAGPVQYLVEIDEAGRVFKTNHKRGDEGWANALRGQPIN